MSNLCIIIIVYIMCGRFVWMKWTHGSISAYVWIYEGMCVEPIRHSVKHNKQNAKRSLVSSLNLLSIPCHLSVFIINPYNNYIVVAL